MTEIRIKIPEEMPLFPLRRKIDELVKEEEIRWALFEKCKEELSLSEGELHDLEKARETVWKETKKKYGL